MVPKKSRHFFLNRPGKTGTVFLSDPQSWFDLGGYKPSFFLIFIKKCEEIILLFFVLNRRVLRRHVIKNRIILLS